MLLRNPLGRIVEVDEPLASELLNSDKNFTVATPEQIANDRPFETAPIKNRDFSVFIDASAPFPDGYGQSHQWLIRGLQKLGLDVSKIYTGQKVGLVYKYPSALARLKTPIKILYSMFESDKVPDEWKGYCELADAIFTPSEASRKAFGSVGVESTVIPLCYNDEEFYPVERKRDSEQPFTFLHYNAFDMRKGWDIVFKAFNEEFKKETPEQVRLIFKAVQKPASLAIPPTSYPKIKVLIGEYTAAQMRELLQEADCYVFPSRGEGFGHTPLEALATGCPVVTVNAHGIAQYFDRRFFNEVAISGKAPAYNDRFRGQNIGEMVEPSIKSLKKQMRFIYEHREEASRRAKRGAKWVKENYTIEKTASLLKKNIEMVVKQKESSGAPTTPTLSIIMLTHNALSYTKKAIESVKKHTKTNYELIVIDNASTDETPEWLKAQKIDRLELSKTNLGVAGGRNLGISLARGEFIVFLDNDVEVYAGWDAELLRTFSERSDCGIAGAKGNRVDALNPIGFSNTVSPKIPPIGIFEVDVVPGFCLCFRRDLIKEIGFQTNTLGKFWHEDLEFCLRAKLAGYRIYANNAVGIVHYGHKSLNDKRQVSDVEMVESISGFFEKSANIGKTLRSDNVVTIYRQPGFYHESYSIIADNMTEFLRKKGMVVIRKLRIDTGSASFDLCKGFDISYNGNRFIILHQENDRMPEDWKRLLKTVDFIFCVSPFVYDLARKQGILEEKLIDISPNGVDGSIFNTKVAPAKDFDENFIFLTVGAMQPRKGTDVLIRAFKAEFEEREKVKLVIKDYSYGWKKWVDDLIGADKRIVHIFEDWSPERLASVYRRAAENGAYISTHRGEAFGLPILEALACGARVGATDWGGVHYYGKGLVDFFPYKLAPSTFHNWPKEPYYTPEEKPMWAEPDIKEVRRWMREVYEFKKYDDGGKAKRILAEFNWGIRLEKFAKALVEKGASNKPIEIE